MIPRWAARTISPPTARPVTRKIELRPEIVPGMRANRRFLVRAVRYVAAGTAGLPPLAYPRPIDGN
jgi:hypothetical protein